MEQTIVLASKGMRKVPGGKDYAYGSPGRFLQKAVDAGLTDVISRDRPERYEQGLRSVEGKEERS